MGLVADRVKETTTTTGTGNVTLAGAATQFQSFNTAFGTNSFFYYTIVDGNNTSWECGEGYLSAATTLVRSKVTASSTAGASAISLSANTHTVFCSITAELMSDETGKIYVMARSMNTL